MEFNKDTILTPQEFTKRQLQKYLRIFSSSIQQPLSDGHKQNNKIIKDDFTLG